MVYRNMRKILYFMDTQAEGTIVPTGSIKRLTSGRIKRLEPCPSPMLSQERNLLYQK